MTSAQRKALEKLIPTAAGKTADARGSWLKGHPKWKASHPQWTASHPAAVKASKPPPLQSGAAKGLPTSAGTDRASQAAWAKVHPGWIGTHPQWAKGHPLTAKGVAPSTAQDDPLALLVKADTRTKFHPLFQQIQQEKAGSAQQQKNITDWYGQYQQAVNAATDRTKTAYDAAGQTSQNLASSASDVDTAQRTAMDKRAQEVAASRGTTAPQDSTAQQASSSRRAATDSFGALLASQGAHQGAYLADAARIGAGAAVKAHVDESVRAANITKAQRDLLTQQADFKLQDYASKIEAQRKQVLEQMIFTAGEKDKANDRALKLKLEQLDNAAALTAKRIEATSREQVGAAHDTQSGKNATTAAGATLGAAATRAAAKGGKNTNLTRTAINKKLGVINDAVSIINAQKNKRGANPAEIRQLILAGKFGGGGNKYHDDEISAAFDIALRGGLSPANIALLNQQGYPVSRIRGHYKPPKKKPKAKRTVIGTDHL